MEIKKISSIDIVFSHAWYHKNYGFDFSEDSAWADPIKMTETNREMTRVLYDRFSEIGLGDKDPKPMPTLNAYGHRFGPAMFGCEIHYCKDQAPAAITKNLDLDEMAKLDVIDMEKSEVIQKAWHDTRILEDRYGFCNGGVFFGSPINTAVSAFGEQFLMACALEPETAQHVMKTIHESALRVRNELSCAINPMNFPKETDRWGLGNCPAIMFSPKMYRDVILSVDKWMRSQYRYFSIHHCGVFDKYIEIYKELNPTELDIGGGSNYKAIRSAFPDAHFSLIINAPDIENKTISEIDELIGNMVSDSGPIDKLYYMYVSDLCQDIDDNKIRAIGTIHERIPELRKIVEHPLHPRQDENKLIPKK